MEETGNRPENAFIYFFVSRSNIAGSWARGGGTLVVHLAYNA